MPAFCYTTKPQAADKNEKAFGTSTSSDTNSPNCPTPLVGNPIDTRTGNKLKVATDYAGTGPFPLALTRTYNSLADNDSGPFGARWTFTFGAKIKAVSASAVDAVRSDGKVLRFNLTGSAWVADADVNGRLQALGSASQPLGWSYVDGEDHVESYDAAGKLLSVANHFGLKHAYSYDAAGRLASVADPFGRSLSFAYDAQNRIVAVSDPAGGVWAYGYDAKGNLASVTDPAGAVQTYLYENAAYPHALTGIVDELGQRYATYTYDAKGLAVSSELAGGADKVAVSYPDPGKKTLVTDALGTARTYTYALILGVPHITSISQPCTTCGQDVSSLTYDANGNVLTRTDFKGVQTTYQYDTTRNLEIRRTEAAGTPQARTITTQWHPTFRLPVKITGPDGIQTFAYDAKGQLTQRTESALDNSQSRTWTYAYNANGQIAQADGPRTDVADIATYAYDAQGNVTTVTDALGHVTRITQYDAHGRPLTVIDPNGLTTRLAYDARGRVLSLNVGGEITRYAYDAAGQPIQTARPDGATLAYAYDAAHRLVQIRDNHGDKIAYTLDPMGNRVKEDWQDPDGALAKSLQRQIDALNRLAALTGAQGQKTQFAYDDNGKLASSTDPLLRTTQYGYDALDRLIESTDPAGAKAHYAYDAAGRLKQVADLNGNTTQYGYDGLGNPTNTDSPDAGLTQKQFDAAGNAVANLDARGIQTHYGYDAQNRLIGIDYPNDPDVLYAYDQGQNALGRLSQVTDASGKTQWQYDAHGRVTQKTQTVDGLSLTLSYSYDSTGRLTQTTYPSGAKVLYQYDAERIVDLSLQPSASEESDDKRCGTAEKGETTTTSRKGSPLDKGGPGGICPPAGKKRETTATPATTPLLSDIHYNATGAPTAWTFGNAAPYTRQYDPDGRPLSYPLGAGIRTLGYDAAGQITGYQGASTPTGKTARINQDQSFTYSLAGRILGAATPKTQLAYDYDANGNLLYRTATEQEKDEPGKREQHTLGLAYLPGGNRIAHATDQDESRTYQYDEAGHLIDDGRHRYTYNDAGRLAQTERSEYRYNGLGQRIAKTVHGQTTLFVYDNQGQLIGEYDATGKPIQETVYLGRTPVAVLAQEEREKSDKPGIYYVHADHLNAPRVIVDQQNKIAWTWNSDPYGSTWSGEGHEQAHGRITYNLRFPGQYYDRETGLHYNVFRDYDPRTGRYIESDPIGLAGGLNPYAYVGSNPINWIDSLGLTQYDIDVAREVAASSQPDLNFPEQYASRDLGTSENGSEIVGLTIPGTGTILDDKYQRPLSDQQAAELLDTIIHEAVHFTLPRNDARQEDESGTGYPYTEASRRTTQELIKEFNRKRKPKKKLPKCK